MAIAVLILAFRLGMGLLGIYPVLPSEGEEVVIALMAVLFLGFMGLGMIAAALLVIRLRTGRRDRQAAALGGSPSLEGLLAGSGNCDRRR